MKMSIKEASNALAIVGLSLSLVSCGEKKKPVEQIRAIKTITVTKKATDQTRIFSGLVYAVNYAYLSFEDVSGRVVKVNVDIGDEVKKGDVLAVLDKQKYALDVKNAQANLKKAEAQLVRAKTEYDREKVLFEKGASFQQRLDTRKFQYKAALSEESSAKANLALAQRNLKHTEMVSPYTGFVGQRFIQPNQEVREGQKIFRIDEKGGLEVQFKVPESVIKRVKLGMQGTVTLAGQNATQLPAKISFLGTAATEGNAFPAKALIINAPKFVKPGMTAQISLPLPVKGKADGFLIPPTAVLLAKKRQMGYVFIYDPKTSTVRKQEVHFSGAQGNLGIINKGLKEGDIVAAAGVAFLLDGMKVKLFKQSNVTNGASQ